VGALAGAPTPSAQPSNSKRASNPGNAAWATAAISSAPNAHGHVSLAACLRHFVQPEALSPSESWVCSHCKRRQPAVKQMSIRRAPPVLCLHVKRFEHCPGSNRILRKLQAPLAFPTDTLDLHPFLTATILKQRYRLRGIPEAMNPMLAPGEAAPGPAIKKDNASGSDAGAGATGPAAGIKQEPGAPFKAEAKAEIKSEGAAGGVSSVKQEAAAAVTGRLGPVPMDIDGAAVTAAGLTGSAPGTHSLRYILYAVICHKGDITGGHYVVYVRSGGHWFLCDDAWVTLVEEEEVARCQAYMLFFCAAEYYQDCFLGLPATAPGK